MATQHVKIKVNNNNQVKFNVQPQKVKFSVGINGRPGKDGETPNISIGEVITGTPDYGAFVEVDPSSVLPNQILNFVIPQGYPGIDGKDGQDGNDGRDGAPGQDGYTPIKGVDYFDGLPGLNGKDGYTPIKGIDYFDGLDGKPGKDGYTPIKGVDYFDGEQGIQGPAGKDGQDYIITEQDIADIAATVVLPNNNILNGTGDNSIQQNAEVESWYTENETVQQYINANTGLADNPDIKIQRDGYNIKVGAFGKSATMLHGKSQALGNKTHAEGSKTIAFENNSHAEGNETFAAGKHSHAEGLLTAATGNASHSEGNKTQALAENSHAEGAYTKASGVSSHAEGHKTEANNDYTHAEGFYSQANGPYSHAEGHKTFANGYYSHSEGNDTHAIGGASHAEGQGTYADNNYSVVMGKYNKRDVYENTETPTQTYAVIVGNGDSNDKRSNAYTLDWSGNGTYAGNLKINGTQEVAVKGVNNNFTAAQTINGTLTVNGDIVQNGKTYETHAEKVFSKNDEIITREGAEGGLGEGEYTGIQAQKYDGTNNGRLGFNAAGEARVGDIGDEQPLLTRDEIANLQTGQVLTWDGDNLKAIGSSEYIKDTDYATSSKGGVVRINPSYGVARNTANHALYINAATNTDIDAKSSVYKPIVPSNLEYAVKSIGDGYYTKETDYATSTKAGVVRPANGLFMSGNTGALVIAKASNEQIDAKTDSYYPIVSSNLDYAVKSVGDGYYVKNDEYATTSTVGVVKANGSGGITVNSAGNISVVKATEGEIDAKSNSYKAIVPANLDYAVKSVGDGYYVTKDDYMTDSNFGVAKVASGLGIWVNANHALYVAKASDAEIDAKSNSYKPIVPANLDYAVKSVGGIVIDCTDTIYPTMDDIPRFNALGNAITDGKYDGSCVGRFKVQYLINGTTSVIAIMEQYLYGTTLYQKVERSTNAYYIRPSTVSYWSIYHHSAIVDNLTSNSGTTALSGKQGKILNDRLTTIENSQIELTQDEYDAMLAAGEIDNEVYYNIVEE